ncbi:uncharacterized [Tachysurus ichikawai]
MLTSCSHFGAHVYQVQVLPSHWKNTPESLLDLVLGVRQGPGPEASTSGGDALTSGARKGVYYLKRILLHIKDPSDFLSGPYLLSFDMRKTFLGKLGEKRKRHIALDEPLHILSLSA